MQATPFHIDGPLILTPQRFPDDRGWFVESWSQYRLAEIGLNDTFVQDNISLSKHTGTLRGLHCQVPPFAQGKLLQVITGAINDVAVDIRPGSSTFGQHISYILSEDSPEQVWIPPGFLHGLITLKPDTRVLYKVTAPYSRPHDRAVAWNDPDLAIDWGTQTPILSDKDSMAPLLKDQPGLFPSQANIVTE